VDAPVLRPLGIGDVVDRVFNLYRGRPLLFLALAAVPYLALFLILGTLALAFGSAFATLGPFVDLLNAPPGTQPPTIAPDVAAAAFGALAVFFLIAIVVAVVLLSAQSAALIEAAAARYLARETNVGTAFRAGLVAAPRVIFAAICVFVAIAVLWIVLGIVFVLAQNVLVVIVGILAGFAVTVFLLASWLVAPVVATLERLGPLATLRRAWTLSEGHRWRILALQLLLAILQVVISTLISFAFIAAFIGDQTVQFVAQQVVNVIASVAWAPVEWAAFTVFYFDLRVRKEALDLQLAAEALPRQA
jgi:hypothetical protein